MLTGVALCFLVFRLYVRLKSFGKLLSDDYLVLFAYSTFLANAILWRFQLRLVYDTFPVAANQKPYTDAWWAELKQLHRSIFASIILFLSCLWALKLSFLLFFWNLGERAKDHRIWWWCVLAMTFAAWIVSVAVFPFNCYIVNLEYHSSWLASMHSHYPYLDVLGHCQRPHLHRLEAHSFRISTAMDIFTDILSQSVYRPTGKLLANVSAVITVPVSMFWTIQLPLRTKLLLCGIFFLTIIVMIVALVRLLVTPTGAMTNDITWTLTWSNAEMAAGMYPDLMTLQKA